MRFVVFLLILGLFCLFPTSCSAANKEKIIFIPHDARPICFQQTAEVVEQLGYEVLTPPEEFFGGKEDYMGQPEELWKWLESNVKSAKVAVIAADSLFYGGLIPSRKHEISQSVIDSRLERFKALHTKNPKMKIYVFTSLMRTPQQGVAGFTEEPDYYVTYGSKIFNLTALMDKSDLAYLSASEQQELSALKSSIPNDVLNDWFSRREKNLTVTKQFIDLLDQNFISYLIVGRDDNSPLCQTHKENRELKTYAEKYNLPKTKFQSLAGIDEFGLLLLTRAVNDLRGEIPTVSVKFNKGKGAKTVPDFSDEEIGNSIENAAAIAGGKLIDEPNKADFVLLVNTDPNGKTYQAHNALPDVEIKLDQKKLDKNAENFAELVYECVEAGYPVGIADITFANGSDNALMENLYNKGLLFKLQAYSGWNTATNSTGFVLGTGILAKNMSNSSKDKLLIRRYLDDWAYQANVRTIIGEQLFNSREGASIYYNLGNQTQAVADRVTWLMREFAAKNLPPFEYLKKFDVTLPWNRMFECNIDFPLENKLVP